MTTTQIPPLPPLPQWDSEGVGLANSKAATFLVAWSELIGGDVYDTPSTTITYTGLLKMKGLEIDAALVASVRALDDILQRFYEAERQLSGTITWDQDATWDDDALWAAPDFDAAEGYRDDAEAAQDAALAARQAAQAFVDNPGTATLSLPAGGVLLTTETGWTTT